ncbi:MAG: glycine/betaine ABC transporter substrate-binding protein, partial [Thermoleophilaceae bacterium]|nr:glycine/betaine ABC transporter substrate-binding protein [Thermoleophilaceae bacterium]
YTGTAWITYMDETRPIPDERDQYRAVARRDLRENGIAWLPYAPFNNTYGVAVRREAAGRLGVRTISDLARLARERPADASICVAEEFLSRDDGLPGLEAAYGFRFPPDRILKLDEGLVYDQVDSGERCNFGEVFLTDGRIGANDLVTLEDDRRFFPKYNPAPTVRAEVLAAAPALRRILERIGRRLDTATMRALNGRVDIEGLTEEEVAESWLAEQGLVPAGAGLEAAGERE